MLAAIACFGGSNAAAADETPRAPVAAPAELEASMVWLGVFVGDAIDGGVQLVDVVVGGPAQKAGLRAGDLLLRLDGNPVPDRDAINVLTRRIRPGNRIAAEIVREGRKETRWLETVARAGPAWSKLVTPPTPAAQPSELDEALHATVVAIPDMLRVHYGAPADRGALVAGVGVSPAGSASALRVGDVILAIDGVPVRDPLTYRIGPGGAARRLDLVRGGERRQIQIAAAPSSPTTTGADDATRALRAEIDRLAAKVKELEAQLERERSRRMR